jgi:hypothetical protein
MFGIFGAGKNLAISHPLRVGFSLSLVMELIGIAPLGFRLSRIAAAG